MNWELKKNHIWTFYQMPNGALIMEMLVYVMSDLLMLISDLFSSVNSELTRMTKKVMFWKPVTFNFCGSSRFYSKMYQGMAKLAQSWVLNELCYPTKGHKLIDIWIQINSENRIFIIYVLRVDMTWVQMSLFSTHHFILIISRKFLYWLIYMLVIFKWNLFYLVMSIYLF